MALDKAGVALVCLACHPAQMRVFASMSGETLILEFGSSHPHIQFQASDNAASGIALVRLPDDVTFSQLLTNVAAHYAIDVTDMLIFKEGTGYLVKTSVEGSGGAGFRVNPTDLTITADADASMRDFAAMIEAI